jgi:uncharacterized oxidoreductase
MLIAHEKLRRLTAAVFERGGSETAEARLVADHLVDANMAGHDSHGVGLIPTYVRHLKAGLVSPNTVAELVRDDGAILLFDGNRGFGRRVASGSIAAAIDRCRDTGVVVAGLRRAHHIGRIGAYGEQAIAAGFVSVHFVNVTDHAPSVAPFGGADARYVTNPVCIAVPGTESTPPVILDMATSKIAAGKVRVSYNKGEQLPPDMVIDPQGRPSTDPGVLYASPRGALLPMGDHKGSGLALICEILAGALTGGGTIQDDNPREGGIINNMLSIIVDPERLVDADWLGAEIDALVAYVKRSPRAADDTPVMVAGDPERAARIARDRDGIPIDDTTWSGVLDAAKTIGVPESEISSITG